MYELFLNLLNNKNTDENKQNKEYDAKHLFTFSIAALGYNLTK